MKNFSNFVLDFYKKEFPNVLFWTGTDSRNEPFKKLMFSLDFIAEKIAVFAYIFLILVYSGIEKKNVIALISSLILALTL